MSGTNMASSTVLESAIQNSSSASIQDVSLATELLICGLDIRAAGIGEKTPGIHIALSGQLCRDKLSESTEGSWVIIGDGVEDVSPLNLAAALKSDNPNRKVLLACDCPSGSFLSRASAASVDEVVDVSKALLLVRQFAAVDQLPKTNTSLSSQPPRIYLAEAPVGDKPGFALALASGRGGVGKSTLSIFLSIAACRRGQKVALLDLETQFGDLGFFCAEDPLFTHVDLDVSRGDSLRIDAVPKKGKVLLLRASSAPEYSDMAQQALSELIPTIAAMSDLVILNCASHWADSHALALESADLMALLMDQRSSSVIACKAAAALSSRLGTPSSKIAYVLNKCSSKAKLSEYDCSMALGTDRVVRIEDGGDAVDECLSCGRPSALLEGKSKFFDSVELALDELVPVLNRSEQSQIEYDPSNVSNKGLLRGIFGRNSG